MKHGLTFANSPMESANCESFECESARATVWRKGELVWATSYSGVLSRSCFAGLRADVIKATRAARVLEFHMQKALMADNAAPDIPRGTYTINTTPAAIIVRPDQYQMWSDYADAMQDIGIMRVVFLYSQQRERQIFVDCLSGAQSRVAHQPPYVADPSLVFHH